MRLDIKTKLSIIIPIYNAEKYLDECLKSIRNQTFCDYEVILINDGSTDNSELICEKYKNADQRFKVIKQNNRGVSYARNIGLKEAIGEYVLFVDADDYIEKNFFRKIIDNMVNTQLLCYGYYKVYKNKKIPVVLNQNINDKEKIQYEILLEENIGGFLWNKVFLREIINRYNLKFKEDIFYCEDLVFVAEYLKIVNRMKYINEAGYCYRMRMNSTSGNFLSLKSCTILNAYEKIIKMYENELDISNLLKQKYLIFYYKLKKILNKNKIKVNYEYLKTKRSMKIKYKIKLLCITFLYPIYKKVKTKFLKQQMFE